MYKRALEMAAQARRRKLFWMDRDFDRFPHKDLNEELFLTRKVAFYLGRE